MMMIHDNKHFITPTTTVTTGRGDRQAMHVEEEDRSLPSLVKQLFTSLASLHPATSQQALAKKDEDEDKHAARMYLATAAASFPDSLFLKMYFSFPAIEEFDHHHAGPNSGNNHQHSCGSSSHHHKRRVVKKQQQQPSSAAVEQCRRLLR